MKINLIALFLVVSQFAFAQLIIETARPNLFNLLEDRNEPMSDGPYRVYLELMETAPKRSEALITELREVSMLAIPRTIHSKYSARFNEKYEVIEYTARDIKTIRITKKNKGRNYALIWAAIGGSIGFATNVLSYNPSTAFLTKKAGNIVAASGGAFVGGLVGYIIGSASIRIPINGSNHNYKLKKEQLRKYVILEER